MMVVYISMLFKIPGGGLVHDWIRDASWGLMKLVENTKRLCRYIVALHILKEWHRLQNCRTTTSPIGGTTFST